MLLRLINCLSIVVITIINRILPDPQDRTIVERVVSLSRDLR